MILGQCAFTNLVRVPNMANPYKTIVISNMSLAAKSAGTWAGIKFSNALVVNQYWYNSSAHSVFNNH